MKLKLPCEVGTQFRRIKPPTNSFNVPAVGTIATVFRCFEAHGWYLDGHERTP